MTSKEALNRLYNHLKAILEEDAPELIRIIKSYYDIVEKDLELLEILKRMNFTKEEAEKVKEWLENE